MVLDEISRKPLKSFTRKMPAVSMYKFIYNFTCDLHLWS